MTDVESTLRSAARRLPAARRGNHELASAAQVAGLLDVAYAEVDSPVGPLVAAATTRGLVRLAYADDGADSVLSDLARRISPRLLEAPARLDGIRRELDEYFAGRRREFEVPLDLSLVRGFGRRVLERTAEVPFGEVSTYAQIASRAGSPRGSRAAGNALGANPIPIVVPCHRVLRSGGGLGGYTGGLDRKRLLLGVEGVSDES
jgi:methylated-DNA-[protein]-cysteine S-methyltransferase